MWAVRHKPGYQKDKLRRKHRIRLEARIRSMISILPCFDQFDALCMQHANTENSGPSLDIMYAVSGQGQQLHYE